jgi:hypothetical protein
MTQKIILTGTADKGNGDPLRTAFTKVNDNFAELYNAVDLTTVGMDIIPATNNTYNIGSSSSNKWRNLYLSDKIYFNSTSLTVDGTGSLILNGVAVATPGGAQVNSNWNAVSGVAQILNKPTIPTDVNQLNDVDGLLGTAITSTGSTPPATHPEGTLWYDTVSGRIYVYFDASWIDASPKGVASSIMSGTKASNATGTAGQISYDANYIYICTTTNTWKRSPLTGGY